MSGKKQFEASSIFYYTGATYSISGVAHVAKRNSSLAPINSTSYLLHHVSFLYDKSIDKLLNDTFGISYSHLKVLYVLELWPYSQQRSIARILGQDDAGVSRIVQQLIDRGLVQRKASPTDGRQQIISLTSAGEDFMHSAHSAVHNAYRDAVSGLTLPEQQQLHRLLHKLHQHTCLPESGCEQYVR